MFGGKISSVARCFGGVCNGSKGLATKGCSVWPRGFPWPQGAGAIQVFQSLALPLPRALTPLTSELCIRAYEI